MSRRDRQRDFAVRNASDLAPPVERVVQGHRRDELGNVGVPGREIGDGKEVGPAGGPIERVGTGKNRLKRANRRLQRGSAGDLRTEQALDPVEQMLQLRVAPIDLRRTSAVGRQVRTVARSLQKRRGRAVADARNPGQHPEPAGLVQRIECDPRPSREGPSHAPPR